MIISLTVTLFSVLLTSSPVYMQTMEIYRLSPNGRLRFRRAHSYPATGSKFASAVKMTSITKQLIGRRFQHRLKITFDIIFSQNLPIRRRLKITLTSHYLFLSSFSFLRIFLRFFLRYFIFFIFIPFLWWPVCFVFVFFSLYFLIYWFSLLFSLFYHSFIIVSYFFNHFRLLAFTEIWLFSTLVTFDLRLSNKTQNERKLVWKSSSFHFPHLYINFFSFWYLFHFSMLIIPSQHFSAHIPISRAPFFNC